MLQHFVVEVIDSKICNKIILKHFVVEVFDSKY